MYTFLYGGACGDARDTSSVFPCAQLQYLFVKEVRQAGGHSAEAKCLSPCSQQARDHMTILPSHINIPTAASPCSAAGRFSGFLCHSPAPQTSGVVIYSKRGNE